MFTVILHIACFPLPSFALAIIVPVPLAFGVTFPELSTVATLVLLLVHSISLFVAFSGNTVALSCNGVLFVNV